MLQKLGHTNTSTSTKHKYKTQASTDAVHLEASKGGTDGDAGGHEAEAAGAAKVQQQAGGAAVVAAGTIGRGEAASRPVRGRGATARRRCAARRSGVYLARARGSAHVRLSALLGAVVVSGATRLDAFALLNRADIVGDRLRVSVIAELACGDVPRQAGEHTRLGSAGVRHRRHSCRRGSPMPRG